MKAHNEMMEAAGFVSAARAAEIVGRELSTIHRWANEGKCQCARSGRRLYIELVSLREVFLDNPVVLQRIDLAATPTVPQDDTSSEALMAI